LSGFSALVLAGSRGGSDPVADYAGVPHKALIRLEGRTLLARVAGALRDAGAAEIAVSTSHAEVRAEADRLGLQTLDEAPGPSLSVQAGIEALGTPLLATTADHAMLEADWVRRFLADIPAEADIAALVASREVVEAAAPGTRRTFLKLADGHWSGCNLFYLANARALAAVALWRRLERQRKQPWRMAGLLGPSILARYALGRLTLGEGAHRLGELAGCRAAVVTTPHGLAAVDVDKPEDLDLVRRLAG
jgi:CTP:molybdopterin cytidylyltransferase MocA